MPSQWIQKVAICRTYSSLHTQLFTISTLMKQASDISYNGKNGTFITFKKVNLN